MAAYILLLALLMLTSPIALASDPSPLQDFCVADEKSTVFVNGHVCKDPKLATPDDFFTSGFDIPGNTANRLGSNVTRVEVDRIPGLNTLGISFARVDFAPFGLNPPHTHPRATEMLTVVEGTLLAGFVTSNPNKFFMKELKKGDVFVIPQGLIHFEVNRGPTKAFTIQGFNSQNPGVITSANALFGSKPPIPDDVLARAFQLDKKLVDWLLWRFSTVNN